MEPFKSARDIFNPWRMSRPSSSDQRSTGSLWVPPRYGASDSGSKTPFGDKEVIFMAVGPKVLIIDDDIITRALLSTFLKSMGCECISTSSGKAPDILKKGTFDAVLLDWRCSELPAGQLLSEIEAIGPEHWKRLLVIADEVLDAQTSELFRLYFITAHIPRNHVLERLWPSLESIFALPRSEAHAPQDISVTRLAYDSFREPRTSGSRGFPVSGRQLLYEHGKTRIDLVIAPLRGPGWIRIVGQVLNAGEFEGSIDKLPVVVLSPMKHVAATTTNRLGEFSLEFDITENRDLRLRVGERPWIFAPLGDMAWTIKKSGGFGVES